MATRHAGSPDRDDGQWTPSLRETHDALFQLMGRLRAHFHKVVEPHGIAPPQALALWKIEGRVSMKDLGLQLGCDPSFVTAIADGIEERGLARREIDQRDRRIKNLVLTRKGTSLRARIQREFLADLPGLSALDDAERRTFHQLLTRMLATGEGSRR